MEYRTLGRTGLKVSPLGLGTSNFGDVTPEDEARRIARGAHAVLESNEVETPRPLNAVRGRFLNLVDDKEALL